MDPNFKPLLTKADGTIPNIYLVQQSWDGSGNILVGGDFTQIADASLPWTSISIPGPGLIARSTPSYKIPKTKKSWSEAPSPPITE